MAAEQQQYPERMVRGEVEVVSRDGDGFKINGEWFNAGQYYKGPRPERGQTVEALVKGRYLRQVKILTGADLDALEGAVEPEELTGDDFAALVPPAPDGDEPNESWGAPAAKAAPRRPVQPRVAPVAGKSRESVRATCALAAATWAQGRADVDSQDLIGIAEMLYAWVAESVEGKEA
jgi:hypothetical protein